MSPWLVSAYSYILLGLLLGMFLLSQAELQNKLELMFARMELPEEYKKNFKVSFLLTCMIAWPVILIQIMDEL